MKLISAIVLTLFVATAFSAVALFRHSQLQTLTSLQEFVEARGTVTMGK